MKTLCCLAMLLLATGAALPRPAFADEIRVPQGMGDDGEVRVPLSVYQQMWQLLQEDPRPAPATYALGTASMQMQLVIEDEHHTARVTISVPIEVYEDEWTLVPVLSSGAALNTVQVDGRPVQLVQTPDGLAWSTARAGTYQLQISYGLDAQRSEAGYVLSLPVPRAAATDLQLVFPMTGLDLAVVPAANLRSTEDGGVTRATAAVPATAGILVSWRVPALDEYTISRAHYAGTLVNDAVVWDGALTVQSYSDQPLAVPLLPAGMTLADVRVDERPATVMIRDGRFATILEGQGTHQVQVRFQTPVLRGDGPPEVAVHIPKVPVSHFELRLPGRKEVTVSPQANVLIHEQDEETLATVFVPLTEQVTLHWVDAVPEDLRTAARANAVLYHAVHAEEGVLHVSASIVYQITHGETGTLSLKLPAEAAVTHVAAPSGGVSDWTETAADDGTSRLVTVFLDREVSGEFMLDVAYEQLLGPDSASIRIPLLTGMELHRQRGMVALLTGSELSLNPTEENGLSRVGENQLPAFIRNALSMRVAHTYKYVRPGPTLVVESVAPEREKGKFDAQVDTLISIGEITLRGTASIEVDVKSGSLMALDLTLPADVNVLGVTGPSLRSRDITGEGAAQRIALEFTQEMTGQFRLEVNYERILDHEEADPLVPTLHVSGAEVEHGRIGVEALTAVEVRALENLQLSPLEVNELPQQMILKTTNPILMAFKYVQATPPARLRLEITRHEEIDVQVAAIETATYMTLFTGDGLAVTTAQFAVRNSRRQFLRLVLPEQSEVWSVFVDGKPARPAKSGEDNSVLIRMINSVNTFPVEIVYATPADPMGFFGRLNARLPRPDMVVTTTRWDLFLPAGPSYRAPDSNMNLLNDGTMVDPGIAAQSALRRAADALEMYGQPLRIDVPRRGVHFAFEKLYATQAPEDPYVRLAYTSATGNRLGMLASLLGVALIWAGIFGLGGTRLDVPRNLALMCTGAGAALVITGVGPLGAPVFAAAVAALAAGAGFMVYRSLPRVRAWRAARAAG